MDSDQRGFDLGALGLADSGLAGQLPISGGSSRPPPQPLPSGICEMPLWSEIGLKGAARNLGKERIQ